MIDFKSTVEQDNRADALLERYDSYILLQVWSSFRQYGVPVSEVEDAIQDARLRLYVAATARPISNPRAYIPRIVRSVLVDAQRRIKALPLSLDENDELTSGVALISQSQETQDPVDILMQSENLNAVIDFIANLSPRQQYAILCTIKSALEAYPDNSHPLRAVLSEHGLEIEFVRWPEDPKELGRLRASLAVARKKLRAFWKQLHADG